MKWPRFWLPPINLWNAPRVETMGQDAGMDASPTWQELKDERDALRADKRMAEWRDQRWRTQILAKECKKLKAERDELAAHVERVTTAAHRLINDLYIDDDEGLLDDSDRMREAIEAAKSAPATSLAMLKAQWQAEALESHARTLISTHRCDEMFAARTVHDVLLSEAHKLRRQAEAQ